MEEVFKTIHDINFKEDFYLYHYTSFETVLKILFNNNLRFNNLYNLNDTTEYKPKIVFSKETTEKEQICARCQSINRHIKVCCFTQDNIKIKHFPKSNNMYFTDRTGRGFALPRMWAQYAANNKGVCLIFNKSLLLTEIDKSFQIIKADSITYVERYKCFKFTPKAISDFKNQVLSRSTDDSIAASKFFSTYPDYIVQNYFTKLSDWRDEHEYRIALFSSDGENLTLHNLDHYLEGIIIGENIDPTDEAILKKLLKKSTPMMKIKFQNREITLTN